MTRPSQLSNGELGVNGGSPFQAYVEEVEDEDLLVDGIFFNAFGFTTQTSIHPLNLLCTNEQEDAVYKLHEALDDLVAASGIYAMQRKRKRSHSPPKCFLREPNLAAKKKCSQLSDIEFLSSEDCVNTSFERPVLTQN